MGFIAQSRLNSLLVYDEWYINRFIQSSKDK